MAKKVSIGDQVEIIDKHDCIIEFQAFQDSGVKFIVKELVILDLNNGMYSYFLLKPPFPFYQLKLKWAKSNKWLSRMYHYIRWNEGFTHYSELHSIMKYYCSKYRNIYTTGREKQQWIQKYTNNNVIDYYTLGVNNNVNNSTGSLYKDICIHVLDNRHKFSKCALSKAYILAYNMGVEIRNLIIDNGNEISGGGEGYKKPSDAATYHEYYSNLPRGNTEK